MHPEARAYVARAVQGKTFDRVLEFGARDVNGSIRDLIVCEEYLGTDIEPGQGVDVVCDAAEWFASGFDLVVCCEVLEHTRKAARIIAAAHRALTPGGLFVVTCATDPRAPHSAVDGGPVRSGEFYRNVTAAAFTRWATNAGFASANVEIQGADLYAQAVK